MFFSHNRVLKSPKLTQFFCEIWSMSKIAISYWSWMRNTAAIMSAFFEPGRIFFVPSSTFLMLEWTGHCIKVIVIRRWGRNIRVAVFLLTSRSLVYHCRYAKRYQTLQHCSTVYSSNYYPKIRNSARRETLSSLLYAPDCKMLFRAYCTANELWPFHPKNPKLSSLF